MTEFRLFVFYLLGAENCVSDLFSVEPLTCLDTGKGNSLAAALALVSAGFDLAWMMVLSSSSVL